MTNMHGRIPTRGSLSTPTVTTIVNKLISGKYDYISTAYPDSVTEVYTFKTGGASGQTVSTLTIIYVDSTKTQLSSLART